MGSNESNAEFLILPEVQAAIPGNPHRVSIWRWIKRGVFPRPICIGTRKLVWRASEVKGWLEERGAAKVGEEGGANDN